MMSGSNKHGVVRLLLQFIEPFTGTRPFPKTFGDWAKDGILCALDYGWVFAMYCIAVSVFSVASFLRQIVRGDSIQYPYVLPIASIVIFGIGIGLIRLRKHLRERWKDVPKFVRW